MKFLLTIVVVGYCVTASKSFPQYHGLEEHIIQQKKPHIPIVKQDFEQHHEGYQYSYQTGNGIHVKESGYIKNKGDKKHETLVQQGTIVYHDEHGHPITLTYVADEHGFQPQGSHLPTPPPIPAAIAKALRETPQNLDHSELEQEAILELGGSQEDYGHY